MNSGRTIGLFGGSFNPPHVAHVLVVAWALVVDEVDEVWAIPTGGHPFGKALAPFDDRMEMCRLAFECFGDRVTVLDIERDPRAHYTIETVRELAKRHPENKWRLILGSDALAQKDDWREFSEIEKLAPPLVITRMGHRIDGAGAAGAGFSLPDVSSTSIRERLAKGKEGQRDFEGLVPSKVLGYIRERRLYQAMKVKG